MRICSLKVPTSKDEWNQMVWSAKNIWMRNRCDKARYGDIDMVVKAIWSTIWSITQQQARPVRWQKRAVGPPPDLAGAQLSDQVINFVAAMAGEAYDADEQGVQNGNSG